MSKHVYEGDYYLDSSWRDDEKTPVSDAALIAEVGESESYSVDETRIYALPDGPYFLATASGCSCWGGEWALVRYDTLEELFEDIGPTGDSDYSYNPSFTGVEELRRQTREGME